MTRSEKLQVEALDDIPIYRIDLSLPPAERYTQLATDFAPRMQALTPLFDEVLQSLIPWRWLRRIVDFFAWMFLWRVYSREETEELKGISKASGVDLYFLVALNVLLDALLGCTSGGVMTSLGKKKKDGEEKRMLHFRTLDWGMDELRSVIVVLEFVRSDSPEPEKVIGRTITYAGFVGVLTGVRQDLSISLNFRPCHNCSISSLRVHQLLVLLGFRPSVCSIIRAAILPNPGSPRLSLDDLLSSMPTIRCAPCYLILSDGTTTAVFERDLLGAHIRTSDEFIVHTNHDSNYSDSHKQDEKSSLLGLETFVEESEERRACVHKKWTSMCSKQMSKQLRDGVYADELVGPSVREETLKRWLRAYPVMNECTHFMCVMDPHAGTIRFLEKGSYVESEEDEDD